MPNTDEGVEPEIVEEEQALDLRRPDAPMTVEEIAALGEEQALAIINSRVQIIRTLRAESIRQTRPQDWLLFKDVNTGRVIGYLQDAGCQRIAPLWGVEVRNITSPKRENSEDGKSYAFTIMGDGFCSITQRSMLNIEGTRYSTEKYAEQHPEGIQREMAVKKAARANLEGTIVRGLTGLKNVPLQDLITASGIEKFEAMAAKGRGYGSQAQRQGAEVQESSDIKAGFEPRCGTCNAVMKYVAAGTTQQGKPYDAFWSCQSREHKYTLKHVQAVAEAKARETEANQGREPGAEG